MKGEDAFAAYYTSMYLIQDTAESLMAHRQSGFSADPMKAYIELWGILQAVIIQQDAIDELAATVGATPEKVRAQTHAAELRDFRDIIAGHPSARFRGTPRSRSFLGRGFGSYSSIMYERYLPDKGKVEHPTVDLGDPGSRNKCNTC